MCKCIRLVLLIFLTYQAAYAEPVTLKCVTSDGDTAYDLTIDIEKREMWWGSPGRGIKYEIINVTDTYITAYQKSGILRNIGGEVWVINRITGAFKKAAVGLYFADKPKGSLETFTFKGRCARRQF